MMRLLAIFKLLSCQGDLLIIELAFVSFGFTIRFGKVRRQPSGQQVGTWNRTG